VIKHSNNRRRVRINASLRSGMGATLEGRASGVKRRAADGLGFTESMEGPATRD